MSEVEIDYTNSKGRRAIRRIIPERIVFQEGNPFHPEPQWLLFATDLDDGRLKAWAMSGIHRWSMGDRETRRFREMTFRCNKCGDSFTGLYCDKCESSKKLSDELLKTIAKKDKNQDLVSAFLKTPLKRTIITDKDGNPYLERITVCKYPDGSRDYLHIIYQSDDDRDMHTHPWNFQSKIIRGRYINHMSTGSVTYGEGQTLVMRAQDAHRLEILDGPVVTLVHRGPKIQEWGFITTEGFVHHEQYLNEKFGLGNWQKGDSDD